MTAKDIIDDFMLVEIMVVTVVMMMREIFEEKLAVLV